MARQTAPTAPTPPPDYRLQNPEDAKGELVYLAQEGDTFLWQIRPRAGVFVHGSTYTRASAMRNARLAWRERQ